MKPLFFIVMFALVVFSEAYSQNTGVQNDTITQDTSASPITSENMKRVAIVDSSLEKIMLEFCTCPERRVLFYKLLQTLFQTSGSFVRNDPRYANITTYCRNLEQTLQKKTKEEDLDQTSNTSFPIDSNTVATVPNTIHQQKESVVLATNISDNQAINTDTTMSATEENESAPKKDDGLQREKRIMKIMGEIDRLNEKINRIKSHYLLDHEDFSNLFNVTANDLRIPNDSYFIETTRMLKELVGVNFRLRYNAPDRTNMNTRMLTCLKQALDRYAKRKNAHIPNSNTTIRITAPILSSTYNEKIIEILESLTNEEIVIDQDPKQEKVHIEVSSKLFFEKTREKLTEEILLIEREIRIKQQRIQKLKQQQ